MFLAPTQTGIQCMLKEQTVLGFQRASSHTLTSLSSSIRSVEGTQVGR